MGPIIFGIAAVLVFVFFVWLSVNVLKWLKENPMLYPEAFVVIGMTGILCIVLVLSLKGL